MIAALGRNRFFRFVVVGTFNTVFCYAVYAGFLFAGLGYAFANFLALVVGILMGFRTQGAFVFGNRDGRRFLPFLLVWGFLYVCNVILIGLLIRGGLDAYWAGAVTLVPVAALSYLLQRYFVFASPARLSGADAAPERDRKPSVEDS
jgi:putative flippase GtrA